MTDMTTHLTRQAAFSRATFGPGPRTEGVMGHIGKELVEVASAYEGVTPSPGGTAHMDAAAEWTDVAILGIDGLMRAIWAAHPGWTADRVALEAATMIVEKQGKNEKRDWPDWRTADPTKAIEHTRGIED
jgi:hypothetical protein